MDRLDSLVRKSLVTVERVNGHTRYGLLETIRQFAQERLTAAGTISAVRHRHAAYFAEQAVVHWDMQRPQTGRLDDVGHHQRHRRAHDGAD